MNALLIGGTGSIGKILGKILVKRGFTVYSISVNTSYADPRVKHYLCDKRESAKFDKLIFKLTELEEHWDVVVDFIEYSHSDALKTLNLLQTVSQHIIVLSTCLVYDFLTTNDRRPKTEHSHLCTDSSQGGYVAGKYDAELVWRNSSYQNWTILRPAHIVGAGTLLGCTPYHNRDSKLVDVISSNVPLKLVNAGRNSLSFVSPKDIADFISRIASKSGSYREIFNVCHENPVTGFDYYSKIGELLGRDVRIENVSCDGINSYGWHMTTFDLLVSSRKAKTYFNFAFASDLDRCLSECLRHQECWESPYTNAIHDRMNIGNSPVLE